MRRRAVPPGAACPVPSLAERVQRLTTLSGGASCAGEAAGGSACAANTYKSTTGTGTCTPCVDNSVTAGSGSSDPTQCTCVNGYYGSGDTQCSCASRASRHPPVPGTGTRHRLRSQLAEAAVVAACLAVGLCAVFVRACIFFLFPSACPTCGLNSFCPTNSLSGCICQAGFTGADNTDCSGTIRPVAAWPHRAACAPTPLSTV